MSYSLRKWSRFIKVRDKFTCQMCSVAPGSSRLESHHIFPKALYPNRELELVNGITLCLRCHRGVVHAENTFNDQGNWKRFVIMFKELVIQHNSRLFNSTNQERIMLKGVNKLG